MQMTPQQIDAALAAGIITADQAAAMRAQAPAAPAPAAQAPAAPAGAGQAANPYAAPTNPYGEVPTSAAPAPLPADAEAPLIGNEEDLRFLRSFADIFITIGVVIVVVAVFIMAGTLDPRGFGWGALAATAVFYAGAEFFGRRRRAHLPTLALAVAFALALATALTQFYASQFTIETSNIGQGWLVPSLLFLAGVGLFYWRIRLPFVFVLLGWGVVFFIMGLVGATGLIDNAWVLIALLFACGIGVLAVALRYDMRDPERIMRFSDNGFWLHTVASPLLLFSFMLLGARIALPNEIQDLEQLANLGDSLDSLPLWALGVIIASVVWGLAINRRIFVLSTLVYALGVVSYLLSQTGMEASTILSASLLIVGGTVVFLGLGWHPARQALLRVLPDLPIFPRPLRTDN